MNNVLSIANSLEKYFKDLPALPADLKKTIANYLYLVALVLGILQTLGLLVLLGGLGILAGFSGLILGAGFAVLLVLISLVAFAITVVTTALYFLAYKPLQAKQTKGWLYLYLIALIGVISIVFSLLTNNFFDVLWGLVRLGLTLYVLYQVKEFFVTKTAAAKVNKSKKTAVEAKVIKK